MSDTLKRLYIQKNSICVINEHFLVIAKKSYRGKVIILKVWENPIN